MDDLSPTDPDILEHLAIGFVHTLRIKDALGRWDMLARCPKSASVSVLPHHFFFYKSRIFVLIKLGI